jgi:hypothetical protein
MTVWAQRAERGNGIDLRVTYGSVSITVAEDITSVRSFWAQLGELLQQHDGETAAAPAVPEAEAQPAPLFEGDPGPVPPGY